MKSIAVIALLLASAIVPAAAGEYGRGPKDIAIYLSRLERDYPETVAGHDDTHLLLKDGTRIVISDRRTDKTFDEMLAAPDIDDMFAIPYPAGTDPRPPRVNEDPGRIRTEALFQAIYGDCRRKEVGPRMRKVAWLPHHGGGSVMFNASAGAAAALEAVSRELDQLPDDLITYLKPQSGTYNCRPIAGTRNMSMHGFGAAIDINAAYSAYWRWAKKGANGELAWQNRIPKKIVDIFEKHGFIWGGRWYHFDTMHFEYRPELLP